MDKKIRNEVAYYSILHMARTKFSFKDIHNFKREIGNLVREDELLEKGITSKELIEFAKEIIMKNCELAFNDQEINDLNF